MNVFNAWSSAALDRNIRGKVQFDSFNAWSSAALDRNIRGKVQFDSFNAWSSAALDRNIRGKVQFDSLMHGHQQPLTETFVAKYNLTVLTDVMWWKITTLN